MTSPSVAIPVGVDRMPRYMVLTLIVLMYTAIFFRVRHNIRSFFIGHGSGKFPDDAESSGAEACPMTHDAVAQARRLPHLHVDAPELQPDGHGLLDSAGSGTCATPVSIVRSHGRPQWENFSFGSMAPLPPPTATVHFEATSIVDPPHVRAHDGSASTAAPSSPTDSQSQTFSEFLRSSQPGCPGADGLPFGRTGPFRSHNATRAVSIAEPARARHQAIARQLRFLFLYPLIYFLLWLPAFISHCLSYTDAYAARPNFALSCLSLAAIVGQCAIDAAIFSWREQPWRHRRRRRCSSTWKRLHWLADGTRRWRPGSEMRSSPQDHAQTASEQEA